MLKFFAGAVAGAVIIAVALVVLWPLQVRAAAAGCGVASWYGTESGNRTASGERFDGTSMTAAHKTLPFGTKLRVTYLGKAIIVRINDRGPFIRGRVLDLSEAAARRLGMKQAGVGKVCFEQVG